MVCVEGDKQHNHTADLRSLSATTIGQIKRHNANDNTSSMTAIAPKIANQVPATRGGIATPTTARTKENP